MLRSQSMRSTDLSGLSTRTYNALRRAGIETLEDLAGWSDEQLAGLRSFGELSLAEVRKAYPILSLVAPGFQALTSLYAPAYWTRLAEAAEAQGYGEKRLSDLPKLVESRLLTPP